MSEGIPSISPGFSMSMIPSIEGQFGVEYTFDDPTLSVSLSSLIPSAA
jgi:hypothetical protein